MRVYVESYGCTSNRADGSKLERLLERRGHEVVSSEEECDSVLFNTCTVVQSTQDRMLHRIRTAEEDVIVAGCMAAAQPELVERVRPDASILESTGVGSLLGEEKLAVETGVEGVVGTIQVAEGCLGNCTYCITKLARGDVRSLPPEEVRRQARRLLDGGAGELRVTSQDNGAYGADIGLDIVDAVDAVLGIEADFRLRIGMMNPSTAASFSDGFDELYRDGRVYDYLHLPVQSGSDRVLERMGRRHTVDDFISVVEDFRDARPDGTLFTDVIAGFPGETEEDQGATVELLESVEPTGFNITRFSPRPGTAASGMREVPHDVKKRRSGELTELRHELGRRVYGDRVGETVEVLVTEEGRGGSVVCRDDRYTPVAIEEELQLGSRTSAGIVRAESTYVVAETV
ncbi:MAG: tRNA-2-methylthio-N(6)-dimethylallyladenosine synthase [Methanonatronarchaeales archaeon]|nr:tRNA-2-methylthio-N(6)-dimethylallyladenosine synthase [Methanonatronarchaeales archaeon]